MPYSRYHNLFTADIIQSNAEIESLINLYHSLKPHYAHQDYNLFYLEKRQLKSENYSNKVVQKINDYGSSLGLENYVHYFLRYTEGSFTKLHRDEAVDKTIITFVEQSPNLIGGETLFYDRYRAVEVSENHYLKTKDDTKSLDGQDIIPVIAPSRTGQSVVYGREVKHGVCEVSSGYRIVLVSWFKNQ